MLQDRIFQANKVKNERKRKCKPYKNPEPDFRMHEKLFWVFSTVSGDLPQKLGERKLLQNLLNLREIETLEFFNQDSSVMLLDKHISSA